MRRSARVRFACSSGHGRACHRDRELLTSVEMQVPAHRGSPFRLGDHPA